MYVVYFSSLTFFFYCTIVFCLKLTLDNNVVCLNMPMRLMVICSFVLIVFLAKGNVYIKVKEYFDCGEVCACTCL